MAGCEFLGSILAGYATESTIEKGHVPASEITFILIAVKFLNYICFTIIKQCVRNVKVHMDTRIFQYYICLPLLTQASMFIVFYSGVDFSHNVVQRYLMMTFFVLELIANIMLFYVFNRYSDEISKNADGTYKKGCRIRKTRGSGRNK